MSISFSLNNISISKKKPENIGHIGWPFFKEIFIKNFLYWHMTVLYTIHISLRYRWKPCKNVSVNGIGPLSKAYESFVLPLNYTDKCLFNFRELPKYNKKWPKSPLFVVFYFILVAEAGIEPAIFRLWAWRATVALPRYNSTIIPRLYKKTSPIFEEIRLTYRKTKYEYSGIEEHPQTEEVEDRRIF